MTTQKAPPFASSRGDATENDSRGTPGTDNAAPSSSEYGADSPEGLSESVPPVTDNERDAEAQRALRNLRGLVDAPSEWRAEYRRDWEIVAAALSAATTDRDEALADRDGARRGEDEAWGEVAGSRAARGGSGGATATGKGSAAGDRAFVRPAAARVTRCHGAGRSTRESRPCRFGCYRSRDDGGGDVSALRCPSCNSPSPGKFPATGFEGEVSYFCPDLWHDSDPWYVEHRSAEVQRLINEARAAAPATTLNEPEGEA